MEPLAGRRRAVPVARQWRYVAPWASLSHAKQQFVSVCLARRDSTEKLQPPNSNSDAPSLPLDLQLAGCGANPGSGLEVTDAVCCSTLNIILETTRAQRRANLRSVQESVQTCSLPGAPPQPSDSRSLRSTIPFHPRHIFFSLALKTARHPRRSCIACVGVLDRRRKAAD